MKCVYKLLIVDDEHIERQALKKLISRSFTSIEIVGEATNGREAVEIAVKTRPDLITMDIKMPELDGVEAIKAIRKRQLFPKFIVVSAFDTFDYAREVMKEGVKEYLLKPAETEEVIQTITRTIGELDSEKEQHSREHELTTRLQKSMDLIQMDWVTSLFLDQVEEFELEDWQRDLIPIKKGTAAIFRLQGNSAKLKEGHIELKKWAEENLNAMVGPLTGQHIPFLFPLSGSGRDKLYKQLQRLQQLQNVSTGQFTLQIGVGGLAETVSEYTRSFRQAAQALEQSNIQHAIKFYEHSMEIKKEKNAAPLYSIEEKLLAALKKGDNNAGLEMLENYLDKLKQLTHYDSKAIRSYLNDFFRLIHSIMFDLGIRNEHIYLLPPARSIIQMEELTRKEILRLSEEMNNWQNSGTQGIIEKAKDYIKNSYKMNLSLEDMAAWTGMSPYYFSKLFKAQTGVTFIDYLTRVRIEESKKSLQYTRLSLKEIAYQIGYNDPNYFSRVFKKVEGVSPKAFRKQHFVRQLS